MNKFMNVIPRTENHSENHTRGKILAMRTVFLKTLEKSKLLVICHIVALPS